jgi:hypothetical protein
MKHLSLCAGFLLALLPFSASAQTLQGDPVRTLGEHEITLGGSGGANTSFDNTFGGVNFSYGSYLSPTLLWSVRQTVNYSNPDVGGTQWNGATRLAFDQHLTARGALRPFIGVNFGRVYGDAVLDTWAAGIEGGAKFYVRPHTFVFAMAEYGWFFKKARNADDAFSSGQINWSVGMGFNF